MGLLFLLFFLDLVRYKVCHIKRNKMVNTITWLIERGELKSQVLVLGKFRITERAVNNNYFFLKNLLNVRVTVAIIIVATTIMPAIFHGSPFSLRLGAIVEKAYFKLDASKPLSTR
jgi:hypothetical protein